MPEPGVPEEGIHANSYHGNNAKGANMTPEQLREAVARAMCDAVNVEGTYEETGTLHRKKVWLTSADAAIALMRPVIRAQALEEAARVADDHRLPLGDFRAPYKIAVAIRALKEKPNE